MTPVLAPTRTREMASCPGAVFASDKQGMRRIPSDRADCTVCGSPLPSRDERESARGRPRRYCKARCKERAKRARELERLAVFHDERGRPDIAERIRNRLVVEQRLWRSGRGEAA